MNAAVAESTANPTIDGLRINGDRLWKSLMELARIGATDKGGVCRLTLTDLDKAVTWSSAGPATLACRS
jgi:hypothetical protein